MWQNFSKVSNHVVHLKIQLTSWAYPTLQLVMTFNILIIELERDICPYLFSVYKV